MKKREGKGQWSGREWRGGDRSGDTSDFTDPSSPTQLCPWTPAVRPLDGGL